MNEISHAPRTTRGLGVSPGIAVGCVLLLEASSASIFRVALSPDRLPGEIPRLRRAMVRCRRQLLEARRRALQEAGEGYARVFDAQLLILEDSSLFRETSESILRDQVNAEWAIRGVVERYLKLLSGRDEPEARERGSDVEDVHARIQQALAGGPRRDLSELKEDVIIVARVLSPSDLVLLNRKHVIGLAIEEGGKTSHTAIIASALRVPAVVGLKGIASTLRSGDSVILDGGSGMVHVDPSLALRESYLQTAREAKLRQERLVAERNLPAITTDGTTVSLLANLELPEEGEAAARSGAQGVGLYRSEFLFLNLSPDLPTEEDHRKVYRALADAMSPRLVVVRTLDLGGEKYFHRILEKEEGNPVLGLRAIRFCLRRKDIFRAQIRGFLRAAAEGGLALMIPMVTGREEILQTREILESCRRELRAEGAPVPDRVTVGAMIETPAAALVADILAREVDFFSIGTNDLIQYSLAIDRGNTSVAYLYRPLHPAVLRQIQGVVDAARTAGIRVAVCGEMAADPVCAALLVGMGLRELSMRPSAIAEVKHLLRCVSLSEMRHLARQALALPGPLEIEDLLHRHLGARLPAGSACSVAPS
ncbi:MAG TPA: phosphoenolpyruvate--protein phosphotransferase [Candidatus Polarisedimenticolia bacterium]|nr:phosphoenolpyruvate--protein phosphotransferase [Candidatus Polarisedimenticolia bacterium]